jgi:hypothetical protein
MCELSELSELSPFAFPVTQWSWASAVVAACDAPAEKRCAKALKGVPGVMIRRNSAWKARGKRDWSFPESGKIFPSDDIDSISVYLVQRRKNIYRGWAGALRRDLRPEWRDSSSGSHADTLAPRVLVSCPGTTLTARRILNRLRPRLNSLRKNVGFEKKAALGG